MSVKTITGKSNGSNPRLSIEERVSRNVTGQDPQVCKCGHLKKNHMILSNVTGCFEKGCKCSKFHPSA